MRIRAVDFTPDPLQPPLGAPGRIGLGSWNHFMSPLATSFPPPLGASRRLHLSSVTLSELLLLCLCVPALGFRYSTVSWFNKPA